MNRSNCLASRFSIQRPTSKPLTSPAKWVANCEASKCVMGAMPLRPRRSACQVSSVPTPQGVTRPMPVTTTLRVTVHLCGDADAVSMRVGLDVVDGVLDRLDLLGVLVGD